VRRRTRKGEGGKKGKRKKEGHRKNLKWRRSEDEIGNNKDKE
jgi:hypothetical protein